MDSKQLEKVRQIVLSTLAQLGIPKAQWTLVTEPSDSPRQGRRNPELPEAGLRIVWMLDRNVLEFYSEDGELMTTVPLRALFPAKDQVEAA